MLLKLLRAVIIGFIVAALLLALVPTLRSTTGQLLHRADNSDSEEPVSYNQGVRRAGGGLRV